MSSEKPMPLPGETPWFDGEVKPVREGLYKRLMKREEGETNLALPKPNQYIVLYSIYDETFGWMSGSADMELAAQGTQEPSGDQELPWCGLDHDPSVATVTVEEEGSTTFVSVQPVVEQQVEGSTSEPDTLFGE